MKITIIRLADRGIPNKERLHLKVLGDVNLAFYVVVDTRYSGTASFDGEANDSFWFTPKAVKAGDSVILYSNRGSNSEEKKADGSTIHFYHWGKPQVLWKDPEACAVLIEVGGWITSPRD